MAFGLEDPHGMQARLDMGRLLQQSLQERRDLGVLLPDKHHVNLVAHPSMIGHQPIDQCLVGPLTQTP